MRASAAERSRIRCMSRPTHRYGDVIALQCGAYALRHAQLCVKECGLSQKSQHVFTHILFGRGVDSSARATWSPRVAHAPHS
ncbi:hypothetical protein XFF6166_170059 [Xanthomonas citri pv. fuscans]|uniref:Uncharacterized protein n=1 Tax=Xanthomonas campestris pv. phaseoli TaxID=317013 RepID=A0A2H1THL7_XANCH|nr:hypothetical protein XFF6166_170059 [Xanthomonas citri pv. fuscans]SON83782.1 hypothetical protein XAP6984_530011 [Xanthomonas phaseoli pv. phaseoli]SON86398.1 hypothetical protein XAP412_480011 [Xanthomonas phaseoli pv. phaseoli]SON90763.1 hypothetical protein XAP7430_490012 [Xanthomonas phaseoli pv. phaseoli]SON93373.1 hypothetical protein XFF6990_10089 [Xanthomonas citri pv. fuscans]